MTLNIDLEPSVAAMLTAKAHARGLPLDGFVQIVLQQEVTELASKDGVRALTGAEKALAFDRWAKSFRTDLHVLPLEAISRENIYRQD
jgi:hypothetical protein